MKNSHAETEITAQRLRLVMTEHAERVIKQDDVSGVGVAWRDGEIRFVVQTDSTDKVERLKKRLPGAVVGFPLFVEVGDVARAAQSSDANESPASALPRLSFWSRICRVFRPHSGWLAFIDHAKSRRHVRT